MFCLGYFTSVQITCHTVSFYEFIGTESEF